MPRIRFQILLLCAVLASSSAYAQRPGLRDSLIQASRALDRSHLDTAKAIYQSIDDRDSHSFAAKFGLGRVAVAEGQWSDATSYFDDAIDEDTSSIAAQYYAGIAYRELGTLRAFLIKNMLWGKATDHFLHVMARDSSYQDVLLQYANLELYRKNYDHMFALAKRQWDLRPDLRSVQFGLFNLYRVYVGTNDADDVIPVLRLQKSDWARYFVAVIQRREGHFNEAEEAFSDMIRNPGIVPPEAVTLAVARMLFDKGDDAHGEAVYWRAVDRITTWLGSALIFEEIKYIVNDGELNTYNTIFSDRKKSQYFHAFWNRRNPSAATRLNIRLGEHYRRLTFAEKTYDFYGTRSQFNDPDKLHYLSFPRAFGLNHEFNDMGLIYLRLGEPDEQQRTSSGMSAQMGREYEMHESWLYKNHTGQAQQILHFAKSNAVGNNWRLTSMPDDPRMLENLVMWDGRYNSLLDENAPEHSRMLDQLRLETEDAVTEVLSTDSHRYSRETELLNVPHSVETFRREGGKTLVSIAHTVPLEAITKEQKNDSQPIRVEVGLSILHGNGDMIGAQLDTLTFPAGSRGSVIELYRTLLKPDSISVSMHLRPLGTKFFAQWSKSLRAPDYTLPEPSISDIQFLLPSSTKSNYDFNGVKVVVSPFEVVPRTKPFMLYWEIYNLTRDADGKTRMTTQVLLTEGNSPPNEDSKVIYNETVDGRDEMVPEFVQLNIEGMSKGLHTVTVRVTDRKRVYTFEKSRLVEIISE